MLLGSTNLADYPHLQPAIRSYTDNYANQFLIYGENWKTCRWQAGGP